MVFTKFKEYGTIRRVYNWFFDENIEIAVVSSGKGERRIEWKLPSTHTLSHILNNPIYAGAYAYGRTKTEVEFKDGRKRLRKGIRKEQNDWDVLILDHHEGCVFRSIPDTHSNSFRTVIPIHSGHPFQSKADTHSD